MKITNIDANGVIIPDLTKVVLPQILSDAIHAVIKGGKP